MAEDCEVIDFEVSVGAERNVTGAVQIEGPGTKERQVETLPGETKLVCSVVNARPEKAEYILTITRCG